MSIRAGAREALIGILVGFIPIVLKILPIQDADTFIAIIELSVFIGAITKMDTVKKIPLKTAIGYFLTTFTLGFLFMPKWERGLQIILLIVYIIAKLELL
jgi:hypothetical protein